MHPSTLLCSAFLKHRLLAEFDSPVAAESPIPATDEVVGEFRHSFAPQGPIFSSVEASRPL